MLKMMEYMKRKNPFKRNCTPNQENRILHYETVFATWYGLHS